MITPTISDLNRGGLGAQAGVVFNLYDAQIHVLQALEREGLELAAKVSVGHGPDILVPLGNSFHIVRAGSISIPERLDPAQENIEIQKVPKIPDRPILSPSRQAELHVYNAILERAYSNPDNRSGRRLVLVALYAASHLTTKQQMSAMEVCDVVRHGLGHNIAKGVEPKNYNSSLDRLKTLGWVTKIHTPRAPDADGAWIMWSLTEAGRTAAKEIVAESKGPDYPALVQAVSTPAEDRLMPEERTRKKELESRALLAFGRKRSLPKDEGLELLQLTQKSHGISLTKPTEDPITKPEVQARVMSEEDLLQIEQANCKSYNFHEFGQWYSILRHLQVTRGTKHAVTMTQFYKALVKARLVTGIEEYNFDQRVDAFVGVTAIEEIHSDSRNRYMRSYRVLDPTRIWDVNMRTAVKKFGKEKSRAAKAATAATKAAKEAATKKETSC